MQALILTDLLMTLFLRSQNYLIYLLVRLGPVWCHMDNKSGKFTLACPDATSTAIGLGTEVAERPDPEGGHLVACGDAAAGGRTSWLAYDT